MSDLRELYQEVILDHNKHPRNFQALACPDREADGFNPLCGDKVTVYVALDGDKVESISFQGSGCAISTASASLMTEVVRGHSVAEALELFDRFHDLVTGAEHDDDDESLGKLQVFEGVREYPNRVKCATLAWHTMRAALEKTAEPVRTE